MMRGTHAQDAPQGASTFRPTPTSERDVAKLAIRHQASSLSKPCFPGGGEGVGATSEDCVVGMSRGAFYELLLFFSAQLWSAKIFDRGFKPSEAYRFREPGIGRRRIIGLMMMKSGSVRTG